MAAHTAITPKQISQAAGGVISMETLEHVIAAAHRCANNEMSEQDGQLLVLCMPGLLEELRDYRLRAADGLDVMTFDAGPDVIRLKDHRP